MNQDAINTILALVIIMIAFGYITRKRNCPKCQGYGSDGSQVCQRCGGKGYL